MCLIEGLHTLPGVQILADTAPLDRRIGLATFSLSIPGFSQDSLARLLCDRYQILVGGGYHCAHILHHQLKFEDTIGFPRAYSILMTK